LLSSLCEEPFTAWKMSSAFRCALVVQWSFTKTPSPPVKKVAGVGLAFLVLAPDGRIRLDYQFIES
jgi:hypothetical protein